MWWLVGEAAGASCRCVSAWRANGDFLTFDSPQVLRGCLAADEDVGAEDESGAECRRRLVRDSPGADPAAAAPALLHQCSTNGRRSRRQRQLLGAQPNIPCRTPGEPWDRNRHGPPLPLVLLLVQVCSENLPTGAFPVSPLVRRAKAVQAQPWVFSVLLCKVLPAERAQEPGSVKGPRPHLLPWRTRRTPATGSPPNLRGARCYLQAFQWRANFKASSQSGGIRPAPFLNSPFTAQ